MQVPPHDLEAERAVLGSLILLPDPRRALRLKDHGLDPESFYRDRHRFVYEAVLSLASRQVGVDSLTIRSEMERLGTKDEATVAEIDDLAGWVPASGNVLHYANIVIAKARWRQRLTAAYEQISAIERQDDEAWLETTRVFAQSPDPRAGTAPERPSNVVVLRTVNEDGEVVGENRYCPECEEHEDQVKGLERDLRSWRTKYANLARDKEAEARRDGWWTDAMKLFEMWKQLANHPRSPFTPDRFFECAPYLHNKDYGVAKTARAIVGITSDPYTKPRKNGTLRRFDEWGRIFKSPDDFEECYNRAPANWRTKLTPRVLHVIEDRKTNKHPDAITTSAGQQQIAIGAEIA